MSNIKVAGTILHCLFCTFFCFQCCSFGIIPKVIKHHYKLVAPLAGGQIRAANNAINTFRDLHQQLIANVMAAGIVEQFEMVNIDK